MPGIGQQTKLSVQEDYCIPLLQEVFSGCRSSRSCREVVDEANSLVFERNRCSSGGDEYYAPTGFDMVLYKRSGERFMFGKGFGWRVVVEVGGLAVCGRHFLWRAGQSDPAYKRRLGEGSDFAIRKENWKRRNLKEQSWEPYLLYAGSFKKLGLSNRSPLYDVLLGRAADVRIIQAWMRPTIAEAKTSGARRR